MNERLRASQAGERVRAGECAKKVDPPFQAKPPDQLLQRLKLRPGAHDIELDIGRVRDCERPDGEVKPLNLMRFMNPREQLVGPPDWSLDGKKIAFTTRLWQTQTDLIQNVIPKR